MGKRIKQADYNEPPQARQDITDIVIRMERQLNSLEKKMDILMSRRADNHFNPGGDQRTFQRHEKPQMRYDANQGGPRRERTLYKAICADCNKDCEVPFRPSQDRPVYCKECFSKRRAGSSFNATRDKAPAQKDPGQEHPFSKFQKGGSRGPSRKKKLSAKRRKK